MNRWPEKGDMVTFWDPDTGEHTDGTVLAVHSWPPHGPSIMVQYVTAAGITCAKFIDADKVHFSGVDKHARCECGSDILGHPGHQYYCPKAPKMHPMPRK